MAAAPDFVHLNVRSHYSLLSSTCRIDELVAAAAEDEQSALALTDSGNLFGAIPFYKACAGAGLKPILGMTAYVAATSRLEPSGAANPTHHLTLLAENDEGWDNIKRLSSQAFLEGFHYRPRMDRELLGAHGRGVIALSGGLQSEISQALLAGRYDDARATASALAELFGQGNFYLEVMQTGYEPQQQGQPGPAQAARRARAARGRDQRRPLSGRR